MCAAEEMGTYDYWGAIIPYNFAGVEPSCPLRRSSSSLSKSQVKFPRNHSGALHHHTTCRYHVLEGLAVEIYILVFHG
jgi:hypothetical protein